MRVLDHYNVPIAAFSANDPGKQNTIPDFLNRDCALSVCDYCDPAGGTWVPPAIQLNGNL